MTSDDYRLVAVPDVFLPGGGVRRGILQLSARERLQEARRMIWAEASLVAQGAAAAGRPMTGPETAEYNMLAARAWELSLQILVMP